MLAAGGSAVDAILATAITLTLVEPVSNGIGSDAYAIVWDGKQLHGLNASGRSPAAWTPEYFAKEGKVPVRGWNSVSVPGCVSAWVELHQKFGKLPFEKLFEPAIRYGREGFMVSPTIAKQWAAQVPELKVQPGFAEAFLPGGRPPATGEVFKWPDHAATLEKIAATRGAAFYRGALAEKIEAHAKQHGAAMRVSDLAAHKSDWVGTLQHDYRGYTIHEIPPNGQGIVALIALGILEHFDIASIPVDSADSFHLQIEAVKLAFADAFAYVADIDYMPFPPEKLLNKNYLQERSKLIDRKKAQPFAAGKPPQGGTVYLTAADASGMMVSMIQSNYMGFGSGVVVPGTGISLQNRGATFVMKEGHPNRVGPKKRPYQTIIPGFVTKDGQAGDELRRDGRHHAAAGPHAGDGAHRRLRPEPAGGLRRPALSQGAGHGRERRGQLPARGGRGPAQARPPHRHRGRLQPVRQRADDLEARRRLPRRERPAPRWTSSRFFTAVRGSSETDAEDLGPDQFGQREEGALVRRGARPALRAHRRRHAVRRGQHARVPQDEPQRPGADHG